MKLPEVVSSYRFPLLLLAALLIGSALGFYLQEKAAILKPIGNLFLNLLFTAVIPLIFFSISASVAGMSSVKRLGKVMGTMLAVFTFTAIIAATVMLTVVYFVPPAAGVQLVLEKPVLAEPLSLGDQITKALSVPNFGDLLSRTNILPLIIFAVIFGVACTMAGESGRRVSGVLSAVSDVMAQLVSIIMLFAPIGIGAYIAALVGEYGSDLIKMYGRSLLIYYPTALCYFFIGFTFYAWLANGREGIKLFWRNILTPAVTSLATGSSVAAIPSNLLASEKIGVPKDIRELVIPMGATIHMDGSVLSAILKITFLFGFFQIPFHGFNDYFIAIGIALLSGVVMAGIPGGGFIGELMIVSLYGFPVEAFPILAIIGTLVDPPATMVNSTGDTICGMLIARVVDGPEWNSLKE